MQLSTTRTTSGPLRPSSGHSIHPLSKKHVPEMNTLLAYLNWFYNRPSYICGYRVTRTNKHVPSHPPCDLQYNVTHLPASPASLLLSNTIISDNATDLIDPNPSDNILVDPQDPPMDFHPPTN